MTLKEAILEMQSWIDEDPANADLEFYTSEEVYGSIRYSEATTLVDCVGNKWLIENGKWTEIKKVKGVYWA